MSDSWRPVFLQMDESGSNAVRGRELLRDLVNGAIPVAVLRGVFSEDNITRNRERVSHLFHTATTTQYANGSLTTVGPYLARYLPNPDTYFHDAAQAQSMLSHVGFDLTVRTRR